MFGPQGDVKPPSWGGYVRREKFAQPRKRLCVIWSRYSSSGRLRSIFFSSFYLHWCLEHLSKSWTDKLAKLEDPKAMYTIHGLMLGIKQHNSWLKMWAEVFHKMLYYFHHLSAQPGYVWWSFMFIWLYFLNHFTIDFRESAKLLSYRWISWVVLSRVLSSKSV